ncbi:MULTISPECIES: hypothetical protein [unclassified Nonomuraea]
MTGPSDLHRRGVPDSLETPIPMVRGVGQIPGLRPRRRPGDGGTVSGADIEVVDTLDELSRQTVTAWLQSTPSPAARQTRLRVVAAFLRWLRATEPGLGLLSVTGAEVDRYCAAARAGGLSTPKPLSGTTVARKRAVLTSLYTFAWRSGALRASRHATQTPAEGGDSGAPGVLTRDERRLLRRGIARLAADGRSAEAAAVGLLEATGACGDVLADVAPQDFRLVADGDGEHLVIVIHTSRDDIVAYPVPSAVRSLVRALCHDRAATEPILRRDDGKPVDQEWVAAALTQAALAGGIPEHRAVGLDPRSMTRPRRGPDDATVVTR